MDERNGDLPLDEEGSIPLSLIKDAESKDTSAAYHH
jgi:hypothetical protein